MHKKSLSLFARITAIFLGQTAMTGLAARSLLTQPEAPPRVFAMVGLALTTMAAIMLLRRLLQPVSALVDLADGSQDDAGKLAFRKDDLGLVARELLRLRDEQVDRSADDLDALQRQKRAVEAIERDLHVTKAEAAYLKVVVDALDGGVRRLAVGDLTVRLTMPFPTEYEGLRADFNHAVNLLEDTLDRVRTGARVISASGAELEAGLAEATQAQARQVAAISSLGTDLDALAGGLKRWKMQSEHLAAIGHNANLDMRRPKEALGEVGAAMDTLRAASSELRPAAQEIIDAAFQANILAMNLGIEASSVDEPRLTAIAEDIRDLAERASEAAKTVCARARDVADAVDRGSNAADQAGREWDAMSIYLNALREQISAIDHGAAKDAEAIVALRSRITALVGESGQQTCRLDGLSKTVSGFSRAARSVDHHATRFTPVTVVKPGGVTVPECVKPPKRGAHLRLVKS